jgi:hypothetical protein
MQFGAWTVVALHPERRHLGSKRRWRCVCGDCGCERLVFGSNLRRGLSKSCGCLSRKKLIERNTKHGHARKGKHTSIYDRWVSMRQRCSNPNHKDYRYYGGLGIGVCEPWDTDFVNYFAYNGHPPPGMSLDRIDGNGNYEPGNVRWATALEQRRNRRPYTGRDPDDDGENYAHDDDDGGAE